MLHWGDKFCPFHFGIYWDKCVHIICNVNILQLLTNDALEFTCVWSCCRTVPTKLEELVVSHFKLVLVNRGLTTLNVTEYEGNVTDYEGRKCFI